MTETIADQPGTAASATRLSRVLSLAWRLPFTSSVVAVMLALGLVTGTLWSALESRPLFGQVAYGLPAFEAGRWYTVVTGALFALEPAQYLPVAGGFLLLTGFAEYHLGTRRVAIAAIATQAVAVVAAAGILWVLTTTTEWAWAVRLADDLDVGFSAGMLGAVAAATVALRPPWRARVRLAIVTYAVLMFLYVGVLWDLEHLIGVMGGLAVGPLLYGRLPRLGRPRITRREWRSLAALAFALTAVIGLLIFFVPADGPLGATSADDTVWSPLITAVVSLLVANSLRKGKRVAWRIAIVLSGFIVAAFALVLLALAFAPVLDPEDDLDLDSSTSLPDLIVQVLLWSVLFLVLLLGRDAFRGPSARKLRKQGPLDGDEREVAIGLLERHGGTSLAWMTTWEGNHWYVPRDPDGGPAGYLAYQLHQGTALALGDPVAPTPEARGGVLDSFVSYWEAQSRVPCMFSASQEVADWATARGWQSVVVAEEAVIDLPDLEFKGKAWQDIRTALNRAGKEDVTYRSGRLADMPRGVLNQVYAISSMWTGEKALPEMGFTLGGVPEALDPEVVVGLAVDGDGTVHGITSWLPAYGPGGVVVGRALDVMRRLPDGFRPTTEFLIASACLEFKKQGAQFVSLSGAPLAHGGNDEAGSALDGLLSWLGAALEPVYGFRSLESFKQKFKPRPQPLYLVFSDESHLARIGLALTRAYLPDTPLRKLAVVGLRARKG
jgi:lysylphosphatidylglycerol synthetase-like protein (DUF2156 family)